MSNPNDAARSLLLSLINPAAAVVALAYAVEGRKAFSPTRIRDAADLRAIVDAHLAGTLLCRVCERKDGHRFTRTGTTFGAYCLLPDGRALWICLDIDGADHARGQTDADVRALLIAVCDALDRRGLPYFIERSGGARGFHVWALFAEPQDGGFAHWLATSITADAMAACPGLTLEAFPKQAKAKTLGSLVQLPLCGQPKAEGGGRIINADGFERDPATIVPCSADVLAPLARAYEVEQRLRAEAERERPKRAYEAYDGQQVDLQDLLEALAPDAITDNDGTVLYCDCPRHESRGRRSLHVNLDERWWVCHACREKSPQAKGAGDAAAFTLARWFLPDDAPAREVFETLRVVDAEVNGASFLD